MKRLTKKAVIEFVKLKLATDDKWVKRALLVLLDRQTDDELKVKKTILENGMGFDSFDAEILTPIANTYKRCRLITFSDMLLLHRRMPRYAKQIIASSESKGKIMELYALVRTWRSSESIRKNETGDEAEGSHIATGAETTEFSFT